MSKTIHYLPPFPVPYPWRPTEVDLQVRLMARLWKAGYDAWADVRVKPHKPLWRGARLDIVIYIHEKAALIIDVKKPHLRGDGPCLRLAHYFRELTHLPVVTYQGLKPIAETLASIEKLIGPPVPPIRSSRETILPSNRRIRP